MIGKPTSEQVSSSCYFSLSLSGHVQSPTSKEKCFRKQITLKKNQLPQAVNYLKTPCFTTVKITSTDCQQKNEETVTFLRELIIFQQLTLKQKHYLFPWSQTVNSVVHVDLFTVPGILTRDTFHKSQIANLN